jgi:hypothetical protein
MPASVWVLARTHYPLGQKYYSLPKVLRENSAEGADSRERVSG